MPPIVWVFVLVAGVSALKTVQDRYAGSWHEVAWGIGLFLLLWLLARGLGRLRHRLPPLPAMLERTVTRILWFGEHSLGTVICFAVGGLCMVFAASVLLSNTFLSDIGAFMLAVVGLVIALTPLIRKEQAEAQRSREP